MGGIQAIPREGQWVGLVQAVGQYNRPVGSDWELAPSKVIVAAGGPKKPDRL